MVVEITRDQDVKSNPCKWVASLKVEDEINQGILKDGFALPAVPHVHALDAQIALADMALQLSSSFEYVG